MFYGNDRVVKKSSLSVRQQATLNSLGRGCQKIVAQRLLYILTIIKGGEDAIDLCVI